MPTMPIFLRNLSKSPKLCHQRKRGGGTGDRKMTAAAAAHGGAAFPTLSPTASASRKSFFDTFGAATAAAICGHALVALYPVSEKKGRPKQCFVTIQQTLFEVHRSQKDAKNKKPAKHLIDFGDVFNVSLHNEPIQLKDDCVYIMLPDTSFFVRPTDSEYELRAWFDCILERTRECRSTKLLRPVFREEFFEASWDVQIVRRPKLKRDYSKQQPEAQSDDLAEKKSPLMGHRRLCICSTSFLLFNLGCRPLSTLSAEAPDPFDRSCFVELPLNVISNYGTQERFFFVRIGRCSEIGGGELWMATEQGQVARSMHERISEINMRESDRRRAQGIKINLPTISSNVLKSRAHRERSQTQNQMHKTDSQNRLRNTLQSSDKISSPSSTHLSQHSSEAELSSSRKLSANSTNRTNLDALSSHHQLHASNGSLASQQQARTDSVSCLQSIPERCLLNELESSSSAGPTTKKSSIAGLLAFRFGAKMSSSSSICGKSALHGGRMDQLTAPSSPVAKNGPFELPDIKGEKCITPTSSLVNLATQSARNSLVGTVLGGLRLNRNNSQKSKLNNNNNSTTTTTNKAHHSSQHQQKGINAGSNSAAASPASFSTHPSYDCAEDYLAYDADERNSPVGGGGGHPHQFLNAPSGSVGSRVSSIARAESRKSSSSNAPMRQFSTSGGAAAGYSPDPNQQQNSRSLIATSSDYLEM